MPGQIGVLGAGGMGSAFAAHLARAGHDVILIGRGSGHIRAVAEAGLRVLSPDRESWTVDVPAAVDAAEIPRHSLDVLIVLTKTFDTRTAAASVRHGLAPEGVAISLQNGLGNDVLLSNVFGGHRTLIGVTTVGATMCRPGEISISASTGAGQSLTHLGRMGLATSGHRGDDIVAALEDSGLPAVHQADVAVPVWDKLALATMSPISAVLRATVGQVWGSSAGRELVRRMFDEVISVGSAQGVSIHSDASWQYASQVFVGTGEHYTSMCTDVLHSRPTELDSMVEAVRRLAARSAVPVPIHDTVVLMLRAMGA